MAEVKEVTEIQLARIKDYIESIKYGSVNIIIQDGKIIQIDKSEKIRLQITKSKELTRQLEVQGYSFICCDFGPLVFLYKK